MGKDILNYFLKKYHTEINNVVQVGAHFGQELKYFKQYNFKNIYLFEPNKHAVEILKSNTINSKNIKIFQLALGNENNIRLMNYSNENYGQSSSLLEPELHKKVQPSISFKDKFEVNVKKFKDLGINNIDFLIMDVQGFELEVLKGFENKLDDVKFIFTEVNRDYLYKNNVLVRDLDSYLLGKGFIRILTSWRTADMPWGDALYVRKSRIGFVKSNLSLIKNLLITNSTYFKIYGLIDPRLIKKRIKKILKRES